MMMISFTAPAEAADALSALQASDQFDAPSLLAPLQKAGETMDRLEFLKLARSLSPGRVTILSSFGAQSAVLLEMCSRAIPDVPVTFLNTDHLFGDTLVYKRKLLERLRMSDNLNELHPDPAVETEDPDKTLFFTNPDRCCHLRKVLPLQAALKNFDVVLSGLRRAHGGVRANIPLVDLEEGRLKISPLFDWSDEAIDEAFTALDLPRHPLVEQGFLSIGCAPCTERVSDSTNSSRAGRWGGADRTECGIHPRLARLDKSEQSTE
ncbi:phosphoadenylyl-sulfate reductase [Hyphobacterium sp. CCMP332]|uniref:phosphoadenylyl-sulfate reductase n=1 Tax=Hyphobacterium sp. CCMP332 TaxID=2749086 RepID=UPI00164FDC59|nr:phosphoadenylyl-sulfate reductase [Hyphobacterium sp. CCMP332]QNL17882.1 phosphoadenylyl-sulfate reductase [Hyphobacterium sp. CCMP332]